MISTYIYHLRPKMSIYDALNNLTDWMAVNSLKLHPDKTEVTLAALTHENFPLVGVKLGGWT